GFRAVAPDMRGYGRSTIYDTHDAYAQEKVVGDMLGLLASLGREKALWVGHDWGSPTVWNIASHHPEKVRALVSLCIPYRTVERGAVDMLPLVDRDIYPIDRFPYGQWEYQRFYHERFERAAAVLGANPRNTVKALFRRGNPDALGKPTGHSN